MNINPNLLDFERNIIYTRKRNDQIAQNNTYGVSNMNYPIHQQSNNSWDNMSYYSNKKEGRTDLQNRFSSYQTLPNTQAFPIIESNNNFFFNNMPLNTRLSNIKQEEFKK
jgi:hypothetical protein